MRTTAIALSVLAAASLAHAQTSNETLRNNEPYLVQSAATSTATGQNYNWPPISPDEYSAGSVAAPGPGVPANTRTWRVISALSDYRASRRRVDGYTHLQRLSGETGTSWTGAYEPETSLWNSIPASGGIASSGPGQRVPHFAGAALHTIGELPMPANQNLYTVTRTFAPVNIPVVRPVPASAPGSEDVALSLKWKGGENMFKVGSQSFVFDWEANNQTWYPCGWWYPSTNTYVYPSQQFGVPGPDNHLWASYTTDEPTISVFSTWGQKNWSALNPTQAPMLGNSDGSHWSDLVRTAGGFGLSVRANGAVPGSFAVPLMNLGNFNRTGFPFLGQTLELFIGDPTLFTFLQAGFVLPLDTSGAGDTPQFNFPPQPALQGKLFGFEAYILSNNLQIIGSTGASWIVFT